MRAGKPITVKVDEKTWETGSFLITVDRMLQPGDAILCEAGEPEKMVLTYSPEQFERDMAAMTPPPPPPASMPLENMLDDSIKPMTLSRAGRRLLARRTNEAVHSRGGSVEAVSRTVSCSAETLRRLIRSKVRYLRAHTHQALLELGVSMEGIGQARPKRKAKAKGKRKAVAEERLKTVTLTDKQALQLADMVENRCQPLGKSYKEIAEYIEIHPSQLRRYRKGKETVIKARGQRALQRLGIDIRKL